MAVTIVKVTPENLDWFSARYVGLRSFHDGVPISPVENVALKVLEDPPAHDVIAAVVDDVIVGVTTIWRLDPGFIVECSLDTEYCATKAHIRDVMIASAIWNLQHHGVSWGPVEEAMADFADSLHPRGMIRYDEGGNPIFFYDTEP